MTQIIWDPKATMFLRKLPRNIARQIYRKVDGEIRFNVTHYIQRLVGLDVYKIRVGQYRLFVDYERESDRLIIRAIRHRRDAYKSH